jgi:hypothetical protein
MKKNKTAGSGFGNKLPVSFTSKQIRSNAVRHCTVDVRGDVLRKAAKKSPKIKRDANQENRPFLLSFNMKIVVKTIERQTGSDSLREPDISAGFCRA